MVDKHALKLDYSDFLCARGMADGSTFRPEAEGKQLKKSKEPLEG